MALDLENKVVLDSIPKSERKKIREFRKSWEDYLEKIKDYRKSK